MNPWGTEQTEGSCSVNVLPISWKNPSKRPSLIWRGCVQQCPPTASQRLVSKSSRGVLGAPGTTPAWPGKQALLLSFRVVCTGDHWKKTAQCPELKLPQDSRHCAGRARHWGELLHATYPLARNKWLQRCPMNLQQEVQTSFSEQKACASQGWQQNKICTNQASAPEQLSSNL